MLRIFYKNNQMRTTTLRGGLCHCLRSSQFIRKYSMIHRCPQIRIRKNSHTGDIVSYSFQTVCGFFNVPQQYCETVYRPYPRRLESLIICRCHCKGSTFSSVGSIHQRSADKWCKTTVSHFKANILHLDSSTLPDSDYSSQLLPSSGPVPLLRACLPWHLPRSHLTGTPIESRLLPCSCNNIACVFCQKQTEYNKTRQWEAIEVQHFS